MISDFCTLNLHRDKKQQESDQHIHDENQKDRVYGGIATVACEIAFYIHGFQYLSLTPADRLEMPNCTDRISPNPPSVASAVSCT